MKAQSQLITTAEINTLAPFKHCSVAAVFTEMAKKRAGKRSFNQPINQSNKQTNSATPINHIFIVLLQQFDRIKINENELMDIKFKVSSNALLLYYCTEKQ